MRSRLDTLSGWLRGFGGLVMVIGLPHFGYGQVVLNEILADNVTVIDNGDGFPDYIELHNLGTTAVDLGAWRLTDDPLNPVKFVFPPGTMIGGRESLIVWADNETNAPGLHTGFGMNNNGETLQLLNAGGFLTDSITFGLQLPDLSIGRVIDGTGAWVLNRPTPMASNLAQELASPARLFINEWAAIVTRPSGVVDDDWLELYNATNLPVLLGGLILSDGSTNHIMTPLSFLGPNDFLQLIADDDAEDGADHLPFRLSSTSGETLTLRQEDMTILNQVTFGPQSTNVSEGRLPDAAAAPYRRFPGTQRTPGDSNFLQITNVVFNEILAHTDPPLEDAIELYNPTDLPVDISFWWLSDERDEPRKFQIPTNTIIQPRSFKVFYEYQRVPGGFNPSGTGITPSFTLNSALGDEVNLFSCDSNNNLTGFRLRVDFGPSDNGVSFGRVVVPVTASCSINPGLILVTNFVAMSQRTFGMDNPTTLSQFRQGAGLSNAAPRIGPIVISEIMYHPPDIITDVTNDNLLDEYIELYNITGVPQPLYDPNFPTNTWRLRNGVSFDFPRNVILLPGSYLVVANFDPTTNQTQLAAFRTLYNMSTNVPVYGPYGGRLSNGGEIIELKRPDTPQQTPPDFGLVPYVDIDRLSYDDVCPWPSGADNTGASAQRRLPSVYANTATNWAAATPSPGSGFVDNYVPQLAPMVDLTTNENWMIVITNRATDLDVPAQQMTYSLDPGAPAGATVSFDGVFQWRPLEDQGPGVYPITMRVVDNGNPVRMASRSFTVTVNEVNRQPTMFVHPQFTKPGLTHQFFTGQDLDVPANPLHYTLAPGAPEGLTIDPATGLVTWAPMASQAPSTNKITVSVQDNGQPNLTNQRTFTIYVRPPEAVIIVNTIQRTPNGVSILWNAELGAIYSFQFNVNLNGTVPWADFFPPFPADSTILEVEDSTISGQLFYRVLQLPPE